MQSTNFAISKTGIVGNLKTPVSIDAIGTAIVCECSNSENLSLQIAGSGVYSVLASTSNDGVTFVPYTRFINSASAATSPLVKDFYLRPNGDYFGYVKFNITGADADFLLTVKGIN